MKSLSALAFFVLSAPLSQAQAPTKEDTIHWLKTKLVKHESFQRHTYSGYTLNKRYTIEDASFNNDTFYFRVKFHTFGKEGFNNVTIQQFTAPLSKLSTNITVKPDEMIPGTVLDPIQYYLTVPALEQGAVLFQSSANEVFPNGVRRKDTMFSIPFNDETLANRVAKALAHLISVSGGKAEPF